MSEKTRIKCSAELDLRGRGRFGHFRFDFGGREFGWRHVRIGVDVGDTSARSPVRTSLMSAISELQRRKELGFGTSSQVDWFCRSRDVSRKGSGDLWVALPSCKADEGGVLDSLSCVCSCTWMGILRCMCGGQRTPCKGIFFQHVGPRVQILVVKLACKNLHHLANLQV